MPHRANVSASSFVSNLVMSAQVSPSTNNSKERYPLCLEMYSRFNCSTTRTNSAVETPFLICTNYEKQPVPSGLPPFRFHQVIERFKKTNSSPFNRSNDFFNVRCISTLSFLNSCNKKSVQQESIWY